MQEPSEAGATGTPFSDFILESLSVPVPADLGSSPAVAETSPVSQHFPKGNWVQVKEPFPNDRCSEFTFKGSSKEAEDLS